MRGWMKCHGRVEKRGVWGGSMRGDFVKIKKGVAVTNQYAAAIRDDKERKGKKYEIYFVMTRLLSFLLHSGSFSCLLAKEQAAGGEKLFMTFYTLE